MVDEGVVEVGGSSALLDVSESGTETRSGVSKRLIITTIIVVVVVSPERLSSPTRSPERDSCKYTNRVNYVVGIVTHSNQRGTISIPSPQWTGLSVSNRHRPGPIVGRGCVGELYS